MGRDERIMLAGEYALDLLEGEDLRQARDLASWDADFRSELDRWQSTFTEMFDVDAVSPPARIRRSVEARIFGPSRPAWQEIFLAPENRGTLVAVVCAKAILIAAIIWMLIGS
ncbi:hypothetical protein [Tropicimonas sp. IMCC34011]|uniref:hypothetical protein n=1 Tax=Tropicimonas sp. IMCC34011 TaxID=2248759 RepID=UPI000E283F07|nr:hypothetical protein [Tropicimonas sp. IMCC34011]